MSYTYSNNFIFSGKMKMADLIMFDYRLVLILERFNIKLGFGDKTIDEVCIENEIDTQFFLIITNTFHNKEYFPGQELFKLNPLWLVEYLKNSHRYYLNEKIPYIIDLISQITSSSNQKESKLLTNFFYEYKTELEEHMKYEDEFVFPYIQVLKKFIDKEIDKQSLPNYTIYKFVNHHNNIEEKITDLKNLLIKYFPAPDNTFLLNKLLYELFELEADLNNHTRIEDKILIPLVQTLEETNNLEK